MITTTATKEDVKYLLEDAWDVDSYDLFWKIFAKVTKKGVIKFPRHSKAELQELSYR